MTAGGPDLQVFVPYVGRIDYLKTAVCSVLRQTDSSWELVVVEDGPQDPAALAWLRALDDDRVRHVCHRTQLGIAGNFQWCVDAASSPLMTIMGCDDELLPQFVTRARRLLTLPDWVSMTHPRVQVMDGDGRVHMTATDRVKQWLRPRTGLVDDHALLSRLAWGNWTYFPAITWRTADLKSHAFDLGLRTALDLDLLIRLASAERSMHLDHQVTFRYRRHSSSVSSREKQAGRFAEEELVARRLQQIATDRGWHITALTARLRPTSRLHHALARSTVGQT